MINLVCGCCGTGFRGEQSPEHDTGYGNCPECENWIRLKNEKEWQRIEKLVADSLKPENRQKFLAYEMPVRRGIVLTMIDEGIITWGIRGKEAQ